MPQLKQSVVVSRKSFHTDCCVAIILGIIRNLADF